jgi:hypothetical protein
MTMMREEEIACPECAKSQKVQICDTINATLNPELKRDLIEGKINFFKCAHCEFAGFMPTSLFYHDMELKYCVYFVPFDLAMSPQFLGRCTSDGTMSQEGMSSPPAGAQYIANPRIVFGIDELVRYVLFRDRLVEMSGEEKGST